jgi:hypothetical protein
MDLKCGKMKKSFKLTALVMLIFLSVSAITYALSTACTICNILAILIGIPVIFGLYKLLTKNLK